MSGNKFSVSASISNKYARHPVRVDQPPLLTAGKHPGNHAFSFSLSGSCQQVFVFDPVRRG